MTGMGKSTSCSMIATTQRARWGRAQACNPWAGGAGGAGGAGQRQEDLEGIAGLQPNSRLRGGPSFKRKWHQYEFPASRP